MGETPTGEAPRLEGRARADEAPLCPDCGTPLSDEPWATGLCLACMARLSLEQPSLLAEIEADRGDPDRGDPEQGHADQGDAEPGTLPSSRKALERGQILGGRYRIRTLLGTGGMGEVWRAFDLKLRVDVALKALRADLLQHRPALETLRQEVRTAREVVSPNVCRVFDLVELEGHELVSMEYIDGETLQQLLAQRSPLDLSEARDLAAQMLAGLEAIHAAGLVHRDVKPENVMLTRAGRVVVMDFGIAGALVGQASDVAGTPAYMAPEQSKGEPLDARTDVYAAGLVLAEMVESGGVRSPEQRRQFWQRCRETPPRLAKTPWAPVLRRCIAGDRDARPASAAVLSRALEEATTRAIEEGVTPYPGLASFTEADAEYFFGRELEVEAMWKKLRRLHVLGLIGPSGTGKTSFLRAGVLPARPDGWGVLVTTPGVRPVTALAEALAVELAGDTDAVRELVGFDDPAKAVAAVKRWRGNHEHALLVIDQFEELFTQSSPEVQERFAELLGRLSIEADVRILLSLRDDFLAECGRYPAFTPIFEALTVLNPLSGSALRRAVVQPALKHGYRFEDDHLVEEILGEVEGERGALPLLAFAAAQLWEGRDRERGVLTRRTYEEIGGVAGALARHADATLEEIGEENVVVVRDFFRRLVTAQRTRATWDRDELLSAFEDREAASRVLNVLIDARLVTSYERQSEEEDAEPRHRVEIIHESLLRSWPRLVRWQVRDEDSAQLLDQLRQAASIWEDRGRPDDLLWTGKAFKEYELWREDYSGALSSTEAEFADAMVELSGRKRRRRRIAVAMAVAFLAATVLVVTGFWRRAVDAGRQVEANHLLSLGRSHLPSDPTEKDPTGALAYAMKRLELQDDPAVRRLVMDALWAGPLAIHVQAEHASGRSSEMSSSGTWLAGPVLAEDRLQGRRLYHRDGTTEVLPYPPDLVRELENDALGDMMITQAVPGRELMVDVYLRGFVVLSPPPQGRVLRWENLGTEAFFYVRSSEELVAIAVDGEWREISYWPLDGGMPRELGRLPAGPRAHSSSVAAIAVDDRVCVWQWESPQTGPTDCHDLPSEATGAFLSFDGQLVGSFDPEGRMRMWRRELGRASGEWSRALGRSHDRAFDATNTRWLAWPRGGAAFASVWNLDYPPEMEPLLFSRHQGATHHEVRWGAGGQWILGFTNIGGLTMWPAARRHPFVADGSTDTLSASFSPDGRSLSWGEGAFRGALRHLQRGHVTGTLSKLIQPYSGIRSVSWHPDGRRVMAGEGDGTTWFVDVVSGEARELPQTATARFSGRMVAMATPYPVAVSPDGRYAAGAGGPELLVWSLEAESLGAVDVRVLVPEEKERGPRGPFPPEPSFLGVHFTPDSRKIVASEWDAIRVWDLDDGTFEILGEGFVSQVSRDGRRVFATLGMKQEWGQEAGADPVRIYDLENGDYEVLPNHGVATVVALDPSESILASGDWQGVIRVGPITGEEPHLLLGHVGPVYSLDFSPDGLWLVSSGADGSVRIWPVPDVTKVPIHTLPQDDLLAFLKRLTNFRAVEDPESETGYSIDYDPFPGWADYPDWLPLAADAEEERPTSAGGSS